MKIDVLIILILLLVSCSSNKAHNSLSNEKLKGDIKSITTLTIYTGAKDTSKIIDEFNNSGNKTVVCVYSSGHVLKFINTYNNYNDLIKAVYLHNGEFSDSTVYKYDNMNNPIELNKYLPDGALELKVKYSYKYDNKGNQIEKKEFNAIGKLSKKTTYKYDRKGNQIENNFYVGDKLLYKTNKSYDDSGNPLTAITYQADFNKENKTIYKYGDFDKAGNWLKQEIYINDTLYKTTLHTIEYYSTEQTK